jgi:hypothetical protein
MAQLKAYDLEDYSDSESNPEGGKQIIDAEPSAVVATTKVRPCEPKKQRKGNASFSHICG